MPPLLGCCASASASSDARGVPPLRPSAQVTLMLGDEIAGQLHPFAFDCKELPTGKTSVTAARDVRIDALLYQSQR